MNGGEATYHPLKRDFPIKLAPYQSFKDYSQDFRLPHPPAPSPSIGEGEKNAS